MSLWLFNTYFDGVMVKMGMGSRGVRFLGDGSGDCLASCMQMTWFYVEEGLRVMVGVC